MRKARSCPCEEGNARRASKPASAILPAQGDVRLLPQDAGCSCPKTPDDTIIIHGWLPKTSAHKYINSLLTTQYLFVSSKYPRYITFTLGDKYPWICYQQHGVRSVTIELAMRLRKGSRRVPASRRRIAIDSIRQAGAPRCPTTKCPLSITETDLHVFLSHQTQRSTYMRYYCRHQFASEAPTEH